MEIKDQKKAVRLCASCGTENGRLDHRCKSCNARMETRPGYVVPEPGDENLSPMMLDWKYHVPFEGTAFPVRSSPDPALLAELQRRKKRRSSNRVE
jgi:hypothetical protein